MNVPGAGAIDIGRTKITAGIIDSRGCILA